MEGNPVVCITQLSCIQKLTPIIDYIYPPNLKPEKHYFPLDFPGIDFTDGIASTEEEYKECLSLLPHFAFGDMKPSMTADVLYFFLPASTGRILYAISYYRRFNSFHVRGNDKVPITLWKSVCLLFRIPFFGAISARLKPIVLSHFINIAARDNNILEDAYHHINNSMSGNNFQYEDLFFDLSNNEKSLVMAFELELLTVLVKAILLERKIVVYSKSAFSVSSNMLALLGLIPAALTLGLPTQYFGRDSSLWQKTGLPLKIFHRDNPIMLICPNNMIGVVSGKKSYLIGITDQSSFKKLERPVDILIDLDTTLITICNKNIYWITYTTLHEDCFFISSVFDDALFKDAISAAKESSRIAINLVGSALAKLPSGLIALARFSAKSERKSSRDDRESIVEFFDKLFPGSTPKWLKKAIDVPSTKSAIRAKSKSKSIWVPFIKKLGSLKKDKNDKAIAKSSKDKSGKGNKSNSAIQASNKQGSSSYENEFKVISEFESRVSLLNEYVMSLLQKAAYIATNERDLFYITAIPDFDPEDATPSGYVIVSMRTLDTDVVNKLSDQLNKKVKLNDRLALESGTNSENTKDNDDNSSDESVEEFNPNKLDDVQRGFSRESLTRQLPSRESLNREKNLSRQSLTRQLPSLEGSESDTTKFDESEKLRDSKDTWTGAFDTLKDRIEEAFNDRMDRYTEIMPRVGNVKYKYIEKCVPQVLVDQISEIQAEYSYPFLDYWIDSTNAKEFINVHNLPEISLPNVKHNVRYGKVKTYTYSNGDEYKGTTKRMLRHGTGKYVSKKGTIYEGEWRRDKREGYGMMKSTNPYFYYSGNWKRDMKSGFGHLKTEFMEYWGQFENNQFNGSGIIVYANGTTYEGGFKDGFYHGQGKLLENKLIKLGEFDQGKLIGTASIIYPTGCIYCGNIQHEIPNGIGYIGYDNDHNFHGYWINGVRFGPGVLSVNYKEQVEEKEEIFPEDAVYLEDTTSYKLKQAASSLKPSEQTFKSCWTVEAYWKNDFLDFSRLITITYPNGDKYAGYMKLVPTRELLNFLDQDNINEDNALLPQGSGLFKSASTGEVYDGEWESGFFNGHGNLLLKEGISFEGDFTMNLFNSGSLTLNTGETINLNLKFPISRQQLIEVANADTSVNISNQHLKAESSPFIDTCLKFNPVNLNFMIDSKDPIDIYGDIKKPPQ